MAECPPSPSAMNKTLIKSKREPVLGEFPTDSIGWLCKANGERLRVLTTAEKALYRRYELNFELSGNAQRKYPIDRIVSQLR